MIDIITGPLAEGGERPQPRRLMRHLGGYFLGSNVVYSDQSGSPL